MMEERKQETGNRRQAKQSARLRRELARVGKIRRYVSKAMEKKLRRERGFSMLQTNEQAEPYAILTMGVDVQADRLEYIIRAWGRDENWLHRRANDALSL